MLIVLILLCGLGLYQGLQIFVLVPVGLDSRSCIFTCHSCSDRYCTAEARISYGNSVCPSVCLSVTTRWYSKPRWDRDSGSSPYVF